MNPYLSKKALRFTLSGIKHRNKNYFYSETGEDALLGQFLGNQTGIYLDLGSGHPILGSNTYKLYTQNWTGICVDPQTQLKLAYYLLRPKDKFIDAVVVGTKQKKITLYRFENSLLTTINPTVAYYHQNQGLKYKKDILVGINIQELIPTQIASNDNFVLSIDIEGSELSVLSAIKFKVQRPKFILVESWDFPWKNTNKVSLFMKKNNYQLIAYSGLTAVFSPNEILNQLLGNRQRLARISE